MQLLLLAALLVLSPTLSASFVIRAPCSVTVRLQQLHSTASVGTTTAASLSERDLTKIFNRFADNYLLLDVPGAGSPGMMQCCHSGCDNCEFARIFDCMTSGRIKWVALYSYRQLVDGREHSPPWRGLFSDSEEEEKGLDVTVFAERVRRLPMRLSIGPALTVPLDEEDLSAEGLARLWTLLGGSDNGTLTARGLAQGLRTLTGAAHGATWLEFKRFLS